MKCDMYLNIDAGTMNPIEHGEVFVTHDGVETDQDLGHYERFINEILTRENYLTNGQVYRIVLDKERALEYGGKCVEPYHQIPPEIILRWIAAGRVHNADVVLIELGGTVGEYEGLLFFEAVRRIKLKSPMDVILIHVGYLPVPPSIGELKSKPIQQSVQILNSLGLTPDIIVGRAEKEIDQKRKEKIALASGVLVENIISNPDVNSIYEIPIVLRKQKLDEIIIKQLGLKAKREDLRDWEIMLEKSKKIRDVVKIGIVGKYQKTGDYTLEDSYVCVVESLKHAGLHFNVQPRFSWIDSESLEDLTDSEINDRLGGVDAIVVPQGWGRRGIEGKIKAAKYARKNKLPYLGLCFGMQMASIEFGRNAVGLKKANSSEVDPRTPHPVIHIMPNQRDYLNKKQYGGTIRLGAWPCVIRKGTLLEKAYKKFGGGKFRPWYQPNPLFKNKSPITNPPAGRAGHELLIFERHRHRYEFNNKYKRLYEKKGFVFSGTSPDGKLVEAIELKEHPFFVGTQFHPEYLSRPLSPHPIFLSFIEAIVNK